MKKLKKRIVISALFIILFFSSVVLATSPENRAFLRGNFSGRVNSSWGYLSGNTVKCTLRNTAAVNWKTSSQSTAHNMYFRVVSSNGQDKGGRLFSYLENSTMTVDTTHDYEYYIQGRRENAVDPTTSVTGTWNV